MRRSTRRIQSRRARGTPFSLSQDIFGRAPRIGEFRAFRRNSPAESFIRALLIRARRRRGVVTRAICRRPSLRWGLRITWRTRGRNFFPHRAILPLRLYSPALTRYREEIGCSHVPYISASGNTGRILPRQRISTSVPGMHAASSFRFFGTTVLARACS